LLFNLLLIFSDSNPAENQQTATEIGTNPSPDDGDNGSKQGMFGGLKKFGRKVKKFGRKVGRKVKKFGRKVGRKVFGWGKRKRKMRLKGLKLKKLRVKKLRTKKLRFRKMKFRHGGKRKNRKQRMGSKMIKMGGKMVRLPG